MKPLLLLLLVMLSANTTGDMSRAHAQEACSKSYVSCLDRCVTRPSKALQDGCMEACQTQNNACYSQVYGGPGPNSVTVKKEPAKDANAAVASDGQQPEAKPPVPPVEPVQSAKPAQTAKPAKTAKPTKTAKPAAKPERRAQ